MKIITIERLEIKSICAMIFSAVYLIPYTFQMHALAHNIIRFILYYIPLGTLRFWATDFV